MFGSGKPKEPKPLKDQIKETTKAVDAEADRRRNEQRERTKKQNEDRQKLLDKIGGKPSGKK